MECLLRTRVRFAQWAVTAISGVVAVLAVAAIAAAQSGGDCYAGRVVGPGERCTYPGTSEDFWVDDSGRGRFIFSTAGTGISLRNTTINGVVYNFAASKQADGTWLIEAAGTTTATTPTTTNPTTTSPTTTMRAVSARFVDVMEGHPVEAIEWAAAQGITLGCEADKFCPDEPLQRRHARVFVERFYDQVLGAGGDDRFTNSGFTRARMMALLHSMAAPTTETAVSARFVDVVEGHPVEAIEWAAAQGITLGCEADMFCPDEPLQRRHARVFVERFYDEVLGAGGDDRFTNSGFTRARMMALLHTMVGSATSEEATNTPTSAATTTAPTTTTTTRSNIPPNPGNTKNCSDFNTQAEAQAWFDRYYPHYGDVARLDGNNDGVVCASLPKRTTTATTTTAPTTTTSTVLSESDDFFAAELTHCEGVVTALGSLVDVTVRGTITAKKAFSAQWLRMQVDGTANGQGLFPALITRTSWNRGDSEPFRLTGLIANNAPSLRCEVRIEWEGRQTSTATTAKAPTTAPTTTTTMARTVTTRSSTTACAVGLTLSPGDECTYEGFKIRIREDGAAVLDGNIGGISMGNTVMNAQSINLNRFRATRSGSTWTIESLP